MPEDHWNIAIAMRRGDDELKRHVDAALGALIDDGTVARALARYHVPPSPARRVACQRRAAIHRQPPAGREPDMQKIQTSKHPYDALARIRSAGELVVGLDQNNLPFSTAHPAPAGLDYEIAGLLAEQLGVSLRVYWAISAHDSYPSKLATKRLCDVILGVMPDDRFAQRVLYSRPYYVARYRLVVRSGEGRPRRRRRWPSRRGSRCAGSKGRPVASLSQHRGGPGSRGDGPREGGLRDRDPRALAGPRAMAGQARVPPARPDAATDAFPIVAAVRKSDRELKDAIDRAWDELDRSGRLAQVFARWHIPYEPGGRRSAGDIEESVSRRETDIRCRIVWDVDGPVLSAAELGCSGPRCSPLAGTGQLAAAAAAEPAPWPRHRRTRRPWPRARRCSAACAAAVTAGPAAAARGPT